MFEHAKFLWALLLLGCAHSSMTNSEAVVKVQAQGSGKSCSDAIDIAKKVAVENTNGAYLSSSQSLDNGKYNESLREYAGGFVESYKVLQQSVGVPCKVIIEAVVRTQYNKVNRADSEPIDLSGYNKLVKQYGTAELAIIKSFEKYPPIATRKTYNPKTKELDVEVEMQPKFLEDTQGILRAVEKPKVFSSGFGKLLFGAKRQKLYAYAGGYCFYEGNSKLNCYTQSSSGLGFKVLVNNKPTLGGGDFQKFAFNLVDVTSEYCDEEMCSERFPLPTKRTIHTHVEADGDVLDIRLEPWSQAGKIRVLR